MKKGPLVLRILVLVFLVIVLFFSTPPLKSKLKKTNNNHPVNSALLAMPPRRQTFKLREVAESRNVKLRVNNFKVKSFTDKDADGVKHVRNYGVVNFTIINDSNRDFQFVASDFELMNQEEYSQYLSQNFYGSSSTTQSTPDDERTDSISVDNLEQGSHVSGNLYFQYQKAKPKVDKMWFILKHEKDSNYIGPCLFPEDVSVDVGQG
ncbi:DUF4352 domain-containing protein [Furfurilactobacillus milii]|uniref:DUF4352 domain-containing protein n=1 Tax=Furfurilactobacillus milii TaxID=2888272 RepID=A0A6N9I368_9LACO|nr:DUF4352 domain-containing protein [Furfurilactobacillus milii]MYV17247.1 DUF4352 domain-containing protein [Furfurilactobacillus milii]